jgi:UDP-N-acetylglucosamine 4,6-dehydratase
MLFADDMGGYYRVPADNRDLNYDLYFTDGVPTKQIEEDYNSHNTDRLDVAGMTELLHKLDIIGRALKGEPLED